MKNPYVKGLKKVRRAWNEGYIAGLREARSIAHSSIVAAEWDHGPTDFETFDRRINLAVSIKEHDQ